MLPKAHRLRESRDFTMVYRLGRRFPSPSFLLYRHLRPGEQLRVGIVTSKKVGNAVVRNRIRRLIREVLRTRWSEWRPGYSLVLVVQPAAVGLSFQQVDEQLRALLTRAEVLGGTTGRSEV